MRVSPKFSPVLDPDFLPASLWNRSFRASVEESGKPGPLAIALENKKLRLQPPVPTRAGLELVPESQQ